MFLLSKLLPLLVLPLGLALLLLLYGSCRSRRWPARTALVILWLLATPLTAEGLWRSLEWPHQRQTAEAVLGPARAEGVGAEGSRLRVVPFPVDFQATGSWAGQPLRDPLRYLPSASGLDSSSRALREWIGRLAYGIRCV